MHSTITHTSLRDASPEFDDAEKALAAASDKLTAAEQAANCAENAEDELRGMATKPAELVGRNIDPAKVPDLVKEAGTATLAARVEVSKCRVAFEAAERAHRECAERAA